LKGGGLMSEYIIVNGELRHADELKHYKYIKKKKVKGKWRYYYDVKDALGYDERENFYKTAGEWIKYESKYNAAKKSVESAEASKRPLNNSDVIAYEYGKKLKNQAIDARTAFKKTPLGKLKQLEVNTTYPSRRVKRYLKKVGGNTSKQINKAKKWLSKLFK
jgi:hypothetical protein